MNERDGWDAFQFACEQRRREHTIGSQDVNSFKVLEHVLRQHRRARKREELTNLLFDHYASWRHWLRKKPKWNENGAPLSYALRQRRRAHRPHLVPPPHQSPDQGECRSELSTAASIDPEQDKQEFSAP